MKQRKKIKAATMENFIRALRVIPCPLYYNKQRLINILNIKNKIFNKIFQ